MAVDRVDRLDEPKEHAHVDGLVRQGPLQGGLTMLGLLLPLFAMYNFLFPPSSQAFWLCMPTAIKSFGGPIITALFVPLKKQGVAIRERWFLSICMAVVNALSLSAWWIYGGGQSSFARGLGETKLHLALTGMALGAGVAVLESIWPQVCYRMGIIDAVDPPTALSLPKIPEGNNPYSDFEAAQRWAAHAVLTIRSLNIIILLPVIDTLFFRQHLFGAVEGLLTDRLGMGEGGVRDALTIVAAALMWASIGMSYRGEWAVRLLAGGAMQALALGSVGMAPIGCLAAHMTRNGLAVTEAVVRRRWHRWNP